MRFFRRPLFYQESGRAGFVFVFGSVFVFVFGLFLLFLFLAIVFIV